MHHHHHGLLRKAFQIIPPLDGSLHKGQAGRVGVVGGSKDYTGAPFYSSYASLRLGVDLAHVICDPVASTVIKTYSPDLMVHSWLSPSSDAESYANHQKEFEQLMDRLHVLVIGPGLGRDAEIQKWFEWTVSAAVKKRINLVLDADALWFLQCNPELIRSYPNAILTPNHVEFHRLLKACSIEVLNESEGELALKLSKALGGCTILQKAPTDIIAREFLPVIKISCEGSPKRCGGQGDILSGLIGAWAAWGQAYFDRREQQKCKSTEEIISPEEVLLVAATLGAEMTRTCSKLTYEKFGRSMQASDMLDNLATAFQEVMHGHTKD